MQLDNYQFHYYLRGKREQPLILFLHGFMGDSQEFEPVISFLSQQFCCLAVDLPGHGQTKILGGEECFTISNTAQALIQLLDRLKTNKSYLFGYSMGGRLALYMALHFPERFCKVVLESSSPGLKTKAERLQRIQKDEQLAQELETGDFPAFIVKWYNQPLFNSIKKHPDFDQMLKQRLKNNPLELAKSLRNIGTGSQPSLWDKLRYNKIPLLLLTGEYDLKFQQINNKIAEICKHSQHKIIPQCGHNIHFENEIIFVKNIVNFL